MSRCYDRSGAEISEDEWARRWKFEREVAKDEVGCYFVSTVWLGLDHSWGVAAPPLIFETMIFGDVLDQRCERWSTEAEALAGHARAVEICGNALAASMHPQYVKHSPTEGST